MYLAVQVRSSLQRAAPTPHFKPLGVPKIKSQLSQKSLIWGLTWRFSYELRKKKFFLMSAKICLLDIFPRIFFSLSNFTNDLIFDHVLEMAGDQFFGQWKYSWSSLIESKWNGRHIAPRPGNGLWRLKKFFIKKSKKRLPRGIELGTSCLHVYCLNHSSI